MQYTGDSYKLVNSILKDNGISMRDLPPNGYTRMLNQAASGSVDFQIVKGANGRPTVQINDNFGDADGGVIEPSSNCPSWIPAALCGGYKAIEKYTGAIVGGSNPLVAIGDAAGDAVGGVQDKLMQHVGRVSMIVLALVLIAIALFFMLKDTAGDVVAGTAREILKG